MPPIPWRTQNLCRANATARLRTAPPRSARRRTSSIAANRASSPPAWYDLRAQSLFEEAFRAAVAEIDKSLEKMIWRVLSRFAEMTGEPARAPSSVTYAMFDGLFRQGLLKHLPGDKKAMATMQSHVRLVVLQLVRAPAPGKRRRRPLAAQGLGARARRDRRQPRASEARSAGAGAAETPHEWLPESLTKVKRIRAEKADSEPTPAAHAQPGCLHSRHCGPQAPSSEIRRRLAVRLICSSALFRFKPGMRGRPTRDRGRATGPQRIVRRRQ